MRPTPSPRQRAAMVSRSTHAPFAAFVAEASQRFGIPAAWIRAVMHAESFGDVRAISPKGAMGLMQIMPETWAEPASALPSRRRSIRSRTTTSSPVRPICGSCTTATASPGFLAAYNAGPARWEDHLATGRPLPAETRAYVARLAPIVGGSSADDTVILAAVVKSWTEAPLFPARPASPSDDTPSATPPQSTNRRPTVAQDWTGLAPQSDGLFVALSNRERPQ